MQWKRWKIWLAPEIVHCHGAFTALIPMYIKKVAKRSDLPPFKVVYSSYTDVVSSTLNNEFGKIAAINDVSEQDLAPFFHDGKIDLNAGAIHYADGIIVGKADLQDEIAKSAGDKTGSGLRTRWQPSLLR